MSWLYSLVFAGLLFSSGTNTEPINNTPGGDDTIVTQSQVDETERIEKTFPLNANGRVSVSNVNGSITLTAWDRNEVRLIAVKTAENKEYLADVDIKIDSKPEYLSVETDYGDWKSKSDSGQWKNRNNGNVTVAYELTIPRGAVLNEIETVNGSVTLSKFTNFSKVSAVNGDVHATNLRGTANLSTVNGAVMADLDQLESGSKIALETVNGSASLVIPSDSNATIKAESLNGNIANDWGLPVRKGKYVGRDLRGKLGNGEVSITLESVNGPLSIKRRNDGRPLSPATNLLSPKGDDDDWDNDNNNGNMVVPDVTQISREVARATADAQKQATRDMRREMAKIKPEVGRINEEVSKEIEKSINSADVGEEIRGSMEKQRDALNSLRDAMFMPGVPRVETKSASITVKGAPKITVDAKECAVRIRGWDKQEVQYSVSQYERGRITPVQVSENHTDSTVNIKILNNDKPGQSGVFEKDSLNTRIEIFVPRKSNIKVVSNGEIRLEGVSGDLEVTGGDEPVNVRDSQGKLIVTNCDGRVRIIGFDGDVNARTVDGDVYLEGTFGKLNGRAGSGSFTLTLPPDANIDLSANTEVETDGFDLAKRGSNLWRLGKGGTKYDFDVADGSLMIRNSNVLTHN